MTAQDTGLSTRPPEENRLSDAAHPRFLRPMKAPAENRGQVLEFGAVDDLWRRYERSEASVGWSRIWSLFVLERWCEIMQVSP